MSPGGGLRPGAHGVQAARGAPGSLVFTAADGTPLTPNMIKNPHRRAREAIGKPKLRFHDLRHSYASQLTGNDVPLQVVQKLLGHKKVTTTTRYSHTTPDQLRRAVAKLQPLVDELPAAAR